MLPHIHVAPEVSLLVRRGCAGTPVRWAKNTIKLGRGHFGTASKSSRKEPARTLTVVMR